MEQIYKEVERKGKVTRLSAFEKNIVDLTLEAVSEWEINNTVNYDKALLKFKADEFDKELEHVKYKNRAFIVGLIIGAAIVGILLTAIFL